MSIELLLKVNIIINWTIKASNSVEDYLYQFSSPSLEIFLEIKGVWYFGSNYSGDMKLVLVFNICQLSLYSSTVAFRSSRLEVFCEKGVLRIFAKFRGKHLCQSLFFNKRDLQLKKKLWNRYFFSVIFANFRRTPFIAEHFGWLLYCRTLRVAASEL